MIYPLNKYKLKDLVIKIGSGATPSGGKSSYSKSGVSLIRSQNVLDFTFSINGLARINDDQANKLSNVIVEPEDVLLNITGDSVARVCQVPNSILPARVNQHVAIIRTQKTKLNPGFLKYYLLNPIFKFNLLSLSSAGATRQALTKRMIEELELTLPPIEFQLVIVKILSSLDDKIELNLQMNKTLEAIAQVIFKEWFVDFRFPGFDGELMDGLPRGWRITSISDVISVKDGTHDSPKPKESGKFLITSKHIKDNFIDFGEAYYISNEDFIAIKKRSEVSPGDVLITMIGTVGNFYFVHESQVEFAIKNIGLFKTSGKPDMQGYLYFSLKSQLTTLYFQKRLAGSTQQYLTLDTLRNTPIIIPEESLMANFNELAKNLLNKIKVNQSEIQTLIALRDLLLPKLMTGKIKVT